jgi:hypothetical protein
MKKGEKCFAWIRKEKKVCEVTITHEGENSHAGCQYDRGGILMEKLTRIESLKECYELWVWLSGATPEMPRLKGGYPGWKEYEKTFGRAPYYCPCCHFVGHLQKNIQNSEKCRRCPPGYDWWTGQSMISDENFPCNMEGSPYKNWVLSPNGSALGLKSARMIADRAKELLYILSKLEGE